MGLSSGIPGKKGSDGVQSLRDLPAFPRETPMRIRLSGRERDVDHLSEMLCVLTSVSEVTTYAEDEPGFVRRYLTLTVNAEALIEIGVLLPPPVKLSTC
jgi:hypothetical protein